METTTAKGNPTKPTHKKQSCTELEKTTGESPQKKQKISHFKQLPHDETLFLLKTLESIVPLGNHEWKKVRSIHSKRYPHRHRTVSVLQENFSALYREQLPTDGLHVPYHVQKAKEIQQTMIERTDIVNVDRVLQDIARHHFSDSPVRAPSFKNIKNPAAQGLTKCTEQEDEPKAEGLKKSAVAANEEESPRGSSDCTTEEIRRRSRVRGGETLLYSALILYILQEQRRNEEERRRREDAFREEIRREEEKRRREDRERHLQRDAEIRLLAEREMEILTDVNLRRRELARQNEDDRRHNRLLDMVILLLLQRKLEESSSK